MFNQLINPQSLNFIACIRFNNGGHAQCKHKLEQDMIAPDKRVLHTWQFCLARYVGCNVPYSSCATHAEDSTFHIEAVRTHQAPVTAPIAQVKDNTQESEAWILAEISHTALTIDPLGTKNPLHRGCNCPDSGCKHLHAPFLDCLTSPDKTVQPFLKAKHQYRT